VELQEKGMVLELKFGDKVKKVHCYFPIAMWLGDIKSQDMLSGRVPSHRRGSPRLFYQCTCPFEDMDDPEHVCEDFEQEEYIEMVRNSEKITVYDPKSNSFISGTATDAQREEFTEKFRQRNLGERGGSPWKPEPIMELERFEEYLENLKSCGCVRVDSTMNDLDYGGSVRGQFGALSIDLLHSLLGGIIKNMLICFMRGLNSSTKELFEEVADRIFVSQRTSEKKYFPRMNFTHGCTNLTQLTCREWVGLMLTTLVVMKSCTGAAVVKALVKKSSSENKKKKKKKPGIAQDDDSSDDG